MTWSPHHARYAAERLALRHAGNGVERIGDALHDAQVDLNPHQVDAALFAYRSPLQDGVILADEVGLGKTIEAGLVILQHWSERKRHILVICPASLRKQWSQELQEKFFLHSVILESASWNRATKEGASNPFEQPYVVICSYHFAAARAEQLALPHWDLVVLDEAHRVRNVYKPDNKIGRALRSALAGRRKLLLTATPLQNSLMELYGLVSFVDEYAFGDERSFRMQFARLVDTGSYEQLRHRIRPYYHRTLRSQVREYVRYTQRIPITQDFVPGEAEQTLYDRVSAYLQREQLAALPSGQRSLMILVLRKLLASSSFAIAGALESLLGRLRAQLREDNHARTLVERELSEDYEELPDTAEEWNEPPEVLSEADRATLEAESVELEHLCKLAVSITENAKGAALLQALEVGFAKARELGADDKIIIFTESRRTQNYLRSLLAEHGYSEDIVLFSGNNNDPSCRKIYREWLESNWGTDRVTGSRTADTRAALIDQFRRRARILIATEAAAEGINLQFCSLVVNYDLPWNPQRIEQRIGRCHRYGQRHDVVVINFLNRRNAADLRVFQLLDEKFELFSGVFGVSDEVLGAVESGVDFEQRIAKIYQACRTPKDIKQEFDQLQLELEVQIDDAMKQTRDRLLEHFDADVHDRLRINLRQSRDCLGRLEQDLWQLSHHILADAANFDDANLSFELCRCPDALNAVDGQDWLGHYRMVRFPKNAHKYRVQHPLAQWVIENGRSLHTPDAELVIDYPTHRESGGQRYSRIETRQGQSGWLQLDRLTVTSASGDEGHLILVAVAASGAPLDSDSAADLLRVGSQVLGRLSSSAPVELQTTMDAGIRKVLDEITNRNQQYFLEAMEKLENRATDLKTGLEQAIKELDRQIRGQKHEARTTAELQGKLALYQSVNALEKERNLKRRDLFGAQDQIDLDKECLIDEVQAHLEQRMEQVILFRLHWRIE